MEIADFIALAQFPPPLRFLVIGGYAVAALGHVRTTFDVDLLVRRSDRIEWEQRAKDLKLPHYRDLFLKYGTAESYEMFLRLLRHG